MKHSFGNTVVVALGGSIVFPEGIDTKFLRRLRTWVKRWMKKGKKFVFVVGGGRISRVYQEAASSVGHVPDEDKDWLGIHATRANAHLLRTIFRDIADPVVIDERYKIKRLKCPVTVASGWKPGWSTDYIAIALADDFNAKAAIIAGKPAFVYDRDDAKHKGAIPLPRLSWREYRQLVPKKWTPGLHAPVDPVGAAYGQKRGIDAVVIAGTDLNNFSKLLDGRDFVGTVIS